MDKKITDWSLTGHRKKEKPRRSWRYEVNEAMEMRGLEYDDWNKNDEWRLWLIDGK